MFVLLLIDLLSIVWSGRNAVRYIRWLNTMDGLNQRLFDVQYSVCTFLSIAVVVYVGTRQIGGSVGWSPRSAAGRMDSLIRDYTVYLDVPEWFYLES